jgi:hypothetical protein
LPTRRGDTVFDRLRTRLELTIVLLMKAMLLFGTSLVVTIDNEARALEAPQREKSTQLERLMVNGREEPITVFAVS